MRKHQALILLIGLLSLSLGAAGHRPVAADISGTWEFTIDLTSHMTKGTKKGSKRIAFVLEQQGEKLTGRCCEPEQKFTGVVQGDKVMFEHDGENRTQKTYTGTIETPTEMTGTVKYIENGVQIQHKWSAIKQDR
ncbi:MAG: hypothetical protein MOB07_27315 [Acidobacteria bacterium]|nr:hypothetical protein [Acidobacteriota bacterium]